LLEVAYYNEKMSVWEPLVEPVFHEGKYRRWELGLEVSYFIIYETTITIISSILSADFFEIQSSPIIIITIHIKNFIPCRKGGGGYRNSLHPSVLPSVLPSFCPAFLSGAYLKKYLRYQLETS
jgi:hypothetical protein